MQTSAKPNKLYIIRKVLMRAIQKCTCHVTQEANFEKKNYFFLILHLILEKVTKFLIEKLSTSEVISQKSVNNIVSTGNIKRIVDKFHTCWNKSSIQYKGVCKRGSVMKFLVTLRISEIFRCIVATLRLALHSAVIYKSTSRLTSLGAFKVLGRFLRFPSHVSNCGGIDIMARHCHIY